MVRSRRESGSETHGFFSGASLLKEDTESLFWGSSVFQKRTAEQEEEAANTRTRRSSRVAHSLEEPQEPQESQEEQEEPFF